MTETIIVCDKAINEAIDHLKVLINEQKGDEDWGSISVEILPPLSFFPVFIMQEGAVICDDFHRFPHCYRHWKVKIQGKAYGIYDTQLSRILKLIQPRTTLSFQTRQRLVDLEIASTLNEISKIDPKIAQGIREDKNLMWKIKEYRLNNRWIDKPEEEDDEDED